MRLFNFEKAWLLTLIAAIFPSGSCEKLPVGSASTPLEGFIDDIYRSAPFETRLGIRAATWLCYLAPIWMWFRFRTFKSLSDDERVKLLEAMDTSKTYVVRELPTLIKTVGALGFCSLPAIYRQVGIDVPAGVMPDWALNKSRADS